MPRILARMKTYYDSRIADGARSCRGFEVGKCCSEGGNIFETLCDGAFSPMRERGACGCFMSGSPIGNSLKLARGVGGR